MLQHALAARLPIIVVTTRDPLNAPEVLSALAGMQVQAYQSGTKQVSPRTYYFMRTATGATDWVATYKLFRVAGSSLVVLNPEDAPDEGYDAGELPVPAPLVKARLFEAQVAPDEIQDYMAVLGGLTLKEIGEVLALTRATRGAAITPQDVVATRQAAFSAPAGLQPVDTDPGIYFPLQELKTWAAQEVDFFLQGAEWLRPRGALFGGIPGTGKTAGAKWLAHQWRVPLYRLDLGGIKRKYVGESEATLRSALAQVDRDEPCVLLLDEIEKFLGDTSSDVTPSLLASLLWWMQEHSTRVFTVLTTNNVEAIPPELIRPGRVDQHFVFKCLTPPELAGFVDAYLSQSPIEPDAWDWIRAKLPKHVVMAPAVVVSRVTAAYKDWLRTEGEPDE